MLLLKMISAVLFTQIRNELINLYIYENISIKVLIASVLSALAADHSEASFRRISSSNLSESLNFFFYSSHFSLSLQALW